MSGDEATSPIKEILYAKISNLAEHKIQSIASGNSKSLIKEITSDCMPKISGAGLDSAEGISTFAEGLLHYLLTNALIPSQRKITVSGVPVDIVIPDMRTLSSDPKAALILSFVRTEDISSVNDMLAEIALVQPIRENIWLVSKYSLDLPYRTYVVNESSNFAGILDDIRGFTDKSPSSKIRIFKVS